MTNSLELLAKIAAMKADNPSPPSKMEFNNVLSAKQLTPTNTNRSNTTTTNVKVEISDDEDSHVSSITSDSTNSKEDESTATAPTKSDSMSSDKESKTKSEPPAKPTKQKAQTPVILPPYPPMHSYHHHPYYPYHYPMHPYGFVPPPPYGYGSHPVYHPHHQAKPHTAATHPKPAKAKKAKPVVAKPTRRAKWTEQEDIKLRSLVQELGASKWSRIALSFPHRNAKQCRARWVDEINPTIVKGDWTPSDDQAIFLGVVHVGTRWASIAKTLKGRTDNSIKNRWHSSIKTRVVRYLEYAVPGFESLDDQYTRGGFQFFGHIEGCLRAIVDKHHRCHKHASGFTYRSSLQTLVKKQYAHSVDNNHQK